jgi:hypothetical protein
VGEDGYHSKWLFPMFFSRALIIRVGEYRKHVCITQPRSGPGAVVPSKGLSCAERRSLMSKYVDAISAVSRELAQEIHLPPAERLHTLAASRKKEWLKAELRLHEQSHGCGVRPVRPNEITA